jgi:alkaline phosphatase
MKPGLRRTIAAMSSGVFLLLLALPASPEPAAQPKVKNVILMISDGQGFNAVRTARHYTGEKAVYEGFQQKYGMQTSPAGKRGGFTGRPYEPAGMAKDFNYARAGATDSAAAATAMFAGVKVYNGEVNYTPDRKALTTYFEKAARAGKSIGVVTNVSYTDATPAAVYGHNSSRRNFAALAFEAANGSNPLNNMPDSLFNPSAGDNNGYDAQGYNGNFKFIMGKGTPAYAAWPSGKSTLAGMAAAALKALGTGPAGFAVMIECGTVDGAGHDNKLRLLIEEQTGFNNAVQAVVDYLDRDTDGNNWGNTLVIVTADHETGHLWGDGTGTFFDVNGNEVFDEGVDYAHIKDRGKKKLPGARFHSRGHTNALVPLYAKGAGAEAFSRCVIGTDPNLRAIYDLDESWSGRYIDNTCVYRTMSGASLN